MRQRMLVAALVAIGLGLISAPQASAAFLRPCAPKSRLQCGRLAVPLDPTGTVKGTVPLAVVRIPAHGPSRGTILFLAGGPGQAANPVLPLFYALYRKVLSSYDVVTFDQRGTGLSGPLKCGRLGSPRAVNRCGRSLGPGIGLYTTVSSAIDIERVRQALGSPRLTLVGVSYGGRVANEYARLFPGHAAALVLDSPVPLTGMNPFGLQRAVALARVLDGLQAGTYANLARTVGRLGSRGRRVTTVTASGRRASVRLTLGELYGVLVVSDIVNPGVRSELPAALASAAAGDFARLARLVGHFRGGGGASEPGVSQALLLATSCAEAPLPWNPAASPAAKLAGLHAALTAIPPRDFGPFSPTLTINANLLIPACLSWPSTPPSPPVTSSAGGIRALVLSGDDDLRTPYETTSTVAAGLPGATLVRIPTVGHSVLSNDTVGCGMKAFAAFLAGAPVAACPASAPRVVPLLPLVSRRLGAVRSRRKRVALTLLGSAATVSDALIDTASRIPLPRGTVRFGGLRAGVVVLHGRSLTLYGRTLTLSGVEVLDGLRVTGSLRIGRHLSLSGRVFVTGRTAAPGTLVFSRSRITGRLGGRRVRLVVKRISAAADVFGADWAQGQSARIIP